MTHPLLEGIAGSNMAAKALRLFAALLVALSLHPPVQAAPILLKAETLDPAAPGARAAMSALVRKSAEIKTRDLYLIQSEGVPTPEWRAVLEKAGAVIRSYVPENAYVVEADADALRAIVADVPRAFLAPFQARWRVDGSLASLAGGARRGEARGKEAEASESAVCKILLFDRSRREAVSARIAALPDCSIIRGSGAVIRARLTAEAIEEVSAWVEVQWIERHVPHVLHNNVAVHMSYMNVRSVWPGGSLSLDLTGGGQVVAVADTGLDTGNYSTLHKDFSGRVIHAYALGRADNWSDPDGHGTHVAGSVLGSGTRSPSDPIRGPAYGAGLIFQSILDSAGGLDGIPEDLDELFSQAYATQDGGTAGARIHSDSWGDDWFSATTYNTDARAVDDFVFKHPDMLILFASGNESRDSDKNGVIDEGSVCAPSTAKNCLTVGASESYRTSGGYSTSTWGENWPYFFSAEPIKSDYVSRPAQDNRQGIAAFSSRGPCEDGRIKPDIVAPGTDILSTRSSLAPDENFWGTHNAYYGYMGGTSMSTPLTAGAAAVARQWLVTKRGLSSPDGATLKALLLAGANSLYPGQYGEGSTREIPNKYPNNVEGWGQVDLGRSIGNVDGIVVKDAQVIAHGESQTFVITGRAGMPISFVMAYADAPASTSASKALVNDLDLTVRTPAGVILHPNTLSGADDLNNVEGVRLSGASSGTYLATVTAKRIATPMATSLTGGRLNATRYSLVVNGGTEVDISIPVAVDNSSLTFTASGHAPWFGQTATTHDGVDAAQSGVIGDSQSSTMKTTVTGPGTISFWWKASCEGGDYDYLEFLADGLRRDKIGGTSTSWTQCTQFLSAGTHEIWWAYHKDSTLSEGADCGWVDQIAWTPNKIPVSFNANGGTCDTASRLYTLGSPYGTLPTPTWPGHQFEGWYTSSTGGTRILAATVATVAVTTLHAHWSTSLTLPVALDNTSLTFTTGGGAAWFGQTDVTHDGVDAARSGVISHSQDSWLQTTVTGPGTISFWWNVSCENPGANSFYDYFDFLVDGIRQSRIGGTSATWTKRSCYVESGTHTFKWNYHKDVDTSAGSDCGWVDQVTWTPGNPLFPVYRFWSAKFRGHFYTISESEKINLETSDPNWKYETVAYKAYTSQVTGAVPLYRFYSSKFKGHFYTRSESEKNTVMGDSNWRYEMVAYYVYPTAVSGARPVYRFWSAKFKHHFYTMSESEKIKLETSDPNWRYEMIAFYAMPNTSTYGIHAASRGMVAEDSVTAGLSASAPGAEGAAVVPGVRLETRPAGLPVEAGETLDLGGLALEARAEEPADFAAGSPAPLGDAAPGLRLSLPGNDLSPALWSAADGTLLEGETGKDTFDFTLPASDVWHRLFIRDGGDHEVWSLWLRALSGE